MNLNNLKPTWQYFKVINGLDQIAHEDILKIINVPQTVDPTIYSFTTVSNSVILGFVLLLIQSC